MKRNKKFLLEFTKNDLSHVVDMGNEITVAYEIELDSEYNDWIYKYAESAGYFISNHNEKDEKEVTVEMINNGRWEPFLTFDIFNKSLRIKSQDVSRFNVGDAFVAWLEYINESKANYYIATILVESGYLNKFNLSSAFRKNVINILNNQYRPSEILKYIGYHPIDKEIIENLSNVFFSSEYDKDILAQIIDGLLKYIPEITQTGSEFSYIGDNLKKILALIEYGGEYTQYKKEFEDSLALLLSLDQFSSRWIDIKQVIQRSVNFIKRKDNAKTDFLKNLIRGIFDNTGKEQEIEFIEKNLYGPFDKKSPQYTEIIEHIRNSVSQSAIAGDEEGLLRDALKFFGAYYDDSDSKIAFEGYRFADGLQILDEDADAEFSRFLNSAMSEFVREQTSLATREFKQIYPEEFYRDESLSIVGIEQLTKEQFAEIAREAISDLFPTTYSNWGDQLEFEKDGSLPDGLEFYPTTYMTLSDALLFIRDLYSDYPNQETFFFSDSTGLHINVGVEGESNIDWNYFKLFLFLNEKFATEGFEKRLESEYSKQIKAGIEKYISQESQYGKYGNKDLVNYIQSLETVSLDDVLKFEVMFNEMMRGYSQKNVGFLVRSERVEFRYPGGHVSLDDIEKATLYYSYLVLLAQDGNYKKEEYLRKAVAFINKIKDRSINTIIKSKDYVSFYINKENIPNNAYLYIIKKLRDNPNCNGYFEMDEYSKSQINSIAGRLILATDDIYGITRALFAEKRDLSILDYGAFRFKKLYFFKVTGVSKSICEIIIPTEISREFVSTSERLFYKATISFEKLKISTESLAAIIDNYTEPAIQGPIIDDLIKGGEEEYMRMMSSVFSPWFGLLYKMYKNFRSQGVLALDREESHLLKEGNYEELYERVKEKQDKLKEDQ